MSKQAENRPRGWYRVRINGEWGCMCWTGKTWNVLDEHMDDEFFDEIGERIPMPASDTEVPA